jgi:hypothetical protein
MQKIAHYGVEKNLDQDFSDLGQNVCISEIWGWIWELH